MTRVSSLLPDSGSHPYYIFAPRYTRTSAGVRALHLLAHWLNRSGFRATVAFYDRKAGTLGHPDLLTPELRQDTIDLHYTQGKTPIVVYPEVIAGNPSQSECVVRYVLNVPGLLGGDTTYAPEELVYGYSHKLSEMCGVPENVLHIPTIDTSVFHDAPESRPRTATCFYGSKYQNVHGQRPFGLPQGCIEITRDLPNSQSPSELADLFRSSTAFYCFENTALATEAVLCGCPAIFMPNPYLNWPIALDELGWDGYAWGTKSEEVQRAQASVQNGTLNYQKTIDLFFAQLGSFIAATQARAQSLPYRSKISIDKFGVHSNELIHLQKLKQNWTLREKLKVISNLVFQ